MKPLGVISIFDEPKPFRRDPYSLAVSVGAHLGVAALVFLGVLANPPMRLAPLPLRYDLRMVDMHMPIPKQRPADKTAQQKGLPSPVQAPQSANNDSTPKAPLQRLQKSVLAKQTLVQPDAPPEIKLPDEVSLASMMMWQAERQAVKMLVPSPQAIAAALKKPVLQRPNNETRPDDIQISSSDLPSSALKLVASTTSPVVVQGPQDANHIPETASTSNQTPTPAAILSISDLHAPEAVVAVPRVNQSAPASTEGTSIGTSSSAGGRELAQGGENGSSNNPSTRRITLPKNGKFSMVLVGNTQEELYPETAGMWSGRLAYTVYLHVGTARSWILQYSLPRVSDNAGNGNSAHLEAPWPTDILLPNLTSGVINADAVIVHGFLNKSGRFENLSVSFPPQFALSKFVLDSLRQWQFRPSTQNGVPTGTEILLIIPEEGQGE
jgi:hypothetical protein